MKVFVTGATGFVGFHTVRALLNAGHTVRLGVRNFSKMLRLYQKYGIAVEDFTLGDINDRSTLQAAIKGCDAVVHTAALVSMDSRKSSAMYHTNVLGTQAVVDAALHAQVKALVHVSSVTALYDKRLSKLDENTPLAPAKNAYARTKVESEQYVQWHIDRGAPFSITYPGGIVGPDDPELSEANMTIASMLNWAVLMSKGGIQLIDVRDLAKIHVGLLEKQQSGRFPVGGVYEPSYPRLAQLLEKIVGRHVRRITMPPQLMDFIAQVIHLISKVKPIDTVLTPEGADYMARWVESDDSKVKSALNLEYRSMEETLKDTIIWLAKEGHIKAHWIANL